MFSTWYGLWRFKDLNRGTFAEKVLSNTIAKDPKYDGYQHGLASMVYKFFDKKTSRGDIKNIPNKELPEEFHKPIIREFDKRKVHSPFIDNIWGADLADMQLIHKLKDLDFYYVLLIFLVNMHGLFLWKIKRELQSLMLFRKF